LIILQHRDQGSTDGKSGAVEGVDEPGALRPGLAEPSLHAPGLKFAAVGTAGYLPVTSLPRQPDLDVIGLHGAETHVAGAQHNRAKRKAETLQDGLGADGHAFVLLGRILRTDNRDQLHLAELVLTNHAAGILAGCPGLGAKAWS